MGYGQLSWRSVDAEKLTDRLSWLQLLPVFVRVSGQNKLKPFWRFTSDYSSTKILNYSHWPNRLLILLGSLRDKQPEASLGFLDWALGVMKKKKGRRHLCAIRGTLHFTRLLVVQFYQYTTEHHWVFDDHRKSDVIQYPMQSFICVQSNKPTPMNHQLYKTFSLPTLDHVYELLLAHKVRKWATRKQSNAGIRTNTGFMKSYHQLMAFPFSFESSFHRLRSLPQEEFSRYVLYDKLGLQVWYPMNE